MIAFDSMAWLMAAPAVGLVIAVLSLWARRVRITRAYAWSPELANVASRHGRWGAVLLGFVGVLIAVAIAGPKFGRRVVTAETKALNIVLAVDISRSMLAEDVAPSRLEKAKREAARIVQDLRGDRVGLIGFAGQSFILSPLTVDAGALRLLIDGLDPDIASAGGTAFAPVLQQGRELLLAGEGIADRVLVVFSDGEAMDSTVHVLEAARGLERDGIRVIFVAEGGLVPANIPVRDPNGILLGFQRDDEDNVIETRRRDDILMSIADDIQAPVISAELGDQAGALRDLVDGFKRSPQATTSAAQDIPRSWIPALAALLLLVIHIGTRRTAALAVLAVCIGQVPADAQGVRNRADEAWRQGDFRSAVSLYAEQVQQRQGGDTTMLNLGTAALAAGDTAIARAALTQAAHSVEPEIRFRALFNLGLMDLQLAERDSSARTAHLTNARQSYREALLLKPHDPDAKWNYELSLRKDPPGDGGSEPQPQQSGGSSEDDQQTQQSGLTRAQAEQILNSMLEEERRTRDALNRRRSQANQSGRRNW